MPAEWEEHFGTIMIYPEREGSWCYGGKFAKKPFFEIARHISRGERVFIAVSQSKFAEAGELFKGLISEGKAELWQYPCNDSWARDTAPTFLAVQADPSPYLAGVDWKFNAWGGDFDGLYRDYKSDDAFAAFCIQKTGAERVEARPFVLEGGSVHSNGAGTILTTEECLLSRGRNPDLSKGEIELRLKKFLGADRVIWLPWGIIGDETNGHVDNMCAFVSQNAVALAWGGGREQAKRCRQNARVLKNAGLKVIKLPLPSKKVRFTAEELNGFTYEDGEIERTASDELAASYVNFYVCNAGVLVPQFGDRRDKSAVKILKKAFKGKQIIPVYTRDILTGGGNIHCLTQQIPAVGNTAKRS